MLRLVTPSLARTATVLAASLALSGCVARTVASVVTAPVKVVSKGVDLATTSQSEADEKRGREMRQREELLGQLDRQYRRHSERCENGDERACAEARRDYDEITRLSNQR